MRRRFVRAPDAHSHKTKESTLRCMPQKKRAERVYRECDARNRENANFDE